MIRAFKDYSPRLDPDCYVDEAAHVIGDVIIGADSSIWPGTVVRGDTETISIGSATSIQDNCVLHAARGYPLNVGSNVTVGHGAILHGCTIEGDCLVGMGAIVMDGAVIGRHCIIGAGALVIGGSKIPPRSMVLGSPAKIVRELREEEVSSIAVSAEHYKGLLREYL